MTTTRASARGRPRALLTPRQAAEFFRILAASGSVSLAAKRTGLNRSTLYLHRAENPAFARRRIAVSAAVRLSFCDLG